MTFKSIILVGLFFITNSIFASLSCPECKSKCMVDGGTRYFDGVPVTLDCWGYMNLYDCSEQFGDDYQHLEKTVQKFRCLFERYDEAKDIFIDLDKIVSSVAILKVAKDPESQNDKKPIIFAGKPMECSRNMLPGITKDCCSDNEGIFNCAKDEKELSQIIKEGRAIEIGGYCYKDVFGICTSYHEAYCVFDSKIARVVQDYGRKQQLGIDFGEVGDDYASLNCRGITREELESIEFDEIDFSPLHSEIYDLYNEEVRPVRKVCGKIPHVTIIDDPYPGCRRHISPGNIEDCLAAEIKIPPYRGEGYGKISVPKNRGSRVAFSDSRHGYYYVTIVNEAMGQHVVSPRTRVNNGEYIELPFSKTQDQTFSFIAHRSDGCSCNQPGSLYVYFNYIRKAPKVEWKEGLCRDV